MIYLVQPPLIQLNSPYPAVYYLRSFLEKQEFPCIASDHSIALFERIFRAGGLRKIFCSARERFKKGAIPGLDNNTARYNTERFLSEEGRWLSCIPRLTAFLRGKDREWGHLLTLANGVLPSGPRFDACVAAFGGQPSPDDGPLLAGKLLEDLADFITVTVDSGFALIRYTENTASQNTPSGGMMLPDEQKAAGYILQNFYAPFLETQWDALERLASGKGLPLILGISIPFPGCFAGAIACARSAKRRFKDRVTVIAGGGFVNTELRRLGVCRTGAELFDCFDYLSFDRGYGSLLAVLDRLCAGRSPSGKEPPAPLYKTMYFDGNSNRVVEDPGIAGGIPAEKTGADNSRYIEAERNAVQTVFPDYSGVDFSRYLCLVDDVNPMHRLWSDGRWLKAYLAYGCYWHACAFCDVTLDYIRNFEPVNVESLFIHLCDQAEKTGVRGVHLVDEAAPPAALLRLAELNRETGLPLVFWGNIRFERDFKADAAAILAAGGLIGASAGIEVATEAGFKRTGKGIGLTEVVRACAAFKEQGILTHAYLIYGYWDEDEGEIIDSAEVLRQLFAAGLLDSAFWHKFVLTCHSRIYAEWQQGRHPGLRVIDNDDPRGNTASKGAPHGGLPFTRNDLSFEGEGQFDKFTEPLDRLLAAWMKGDYNSSGFPFKTPPPTVSPGLVTDLLDQYARDKDRDAIPANAAEQMLFLGSRPMAGGGKRKARIRWRWRLEEHSITVKAEEEAGTGSAAERAERIAALLEGAGKERGKTGLYQELCGCLGEKAAKAAWRKLREGGLVKSTIF
ncbi:MAG: radical SAM protein [Treponema sp.]|jgi:hypothetical protein|nr:radical SAM protein [Treponema sp.]